MKLFTYLSQIWKNTSLRKKIVYTLAILALYRMLVMIPVPTVDIATLMEQWLGSLWGSELGSFLMLLWGSIERFSLVAIGLGPYINASIIMQLMTAVIPKLEELTEQGEQWQQKIQQYTRYLSFPLAFLQGIGMVYFINYLFGGGVINTASMGVVLLSAFALAIGAMIVMRLGELMTEKGISNGISILIFASIVAWMSGQISTAFSWSSNPVWVFIFMALFILVLILLSILILRSIKEIPIVYSRQWQVQETSVLPLPMNPVGMIPIIFALAFASFPYLLSQLFLRLGTQNQTIMNIANRIELNFNIYSQQPGRWAIIIYFILIVAFTFFYAMIQFNPDRMAHNIQQRGGFVPGMRPGEETAKYISKTLNHLCLRGGMGLALLGVLNFVIVEIPFIQQLTYDLWSLPLVVTGSGIIIIVWVVQDLVSKIDAEILMTKYDVKL